jgi:hypothetical protein
VRIRSFGRVFFRRRYDQPRPMKGIFVAISVMNWTLASSGKLAM